MLHQQHATSRQVKLPEELTHHFPCIDSSSQHPFLPEYVSLLLPLSQPCPGLRSPQQPCPTYQATLTELISLDSTCSSHGDHLLPRPKTTVNKQCFVVVLHSRLGKGGHFGCMQLALKFSLQEKHEQKQEIGNTVRYFKYTYTI